MEGFVVDLLRVGSVGIFSFCHVTREQPSNDLGLDNTGTLHAHNRAIFNRIFARVKKHPTNISKHTTTNLINTSTRKEQNTYSKSSEIEKQKEEKEEKKAIEKERRK